MDLLDADFDCPCCGAPLSVTVDPQEGPMQEQIQDCEVCCRPLRLEIRLRPRGLAPRVEAAPESDLG